MIKNKKYILLPFCILLYAKSQAQKKQYQSLNNHYSIEIPSTFDIIPTVAFKNREKHKTTIPSIFETGFYFTKNKGFFDYPYFLVQYIPSNSDLSAMRFEDIANNINLILANQRKKLLISKNTTEIGVVKSFLVISINTDSAKHSILIKSIVNTTLKGETTVYQKYYVTKFGFISILGYSKEAEATKFEAVFNTLTSSLKIDKNYIYKENEKQVVFNRFKWLQFLACFLLSLMVFCFIKYWENIKTIISNRD